MRKVLIILLFPTCLIKAQDVPLNATSNVENVQVELTKFVLKHPPTAVVPPTDMAAEVQLLTVVPHKVLVQAIAALPAYPAGTSGQDLRNAGIEGGLLYAATYKDLTKDDLPELLADKNGAALIMAVDKKWQDDPTVVDYLLKALAQFQVVLPSDFFNSLNTQILALAAESKDPRVVSAFADLVKKATSDKDPPQDLLRLLVELCISSTNVTKQGYVTVIFPLITPDRIMLAVLCNAVAQPHTTLLTNSEFTTAALAKLQALPETPFIDLILAYLGNTRGFTKTITSYFQPNKNETYHGYEGLDTPQTLEITRKCFLRTVIYSGTGDKFEGIKNNYAAATYQNGIWTVPALP